MVLVAKKHYHEKSTPAVEKTPGAVLMQRLTYITPLAWLLLLTIACLAPFAGKAFFTDDTLFLRAAQHIQKHPLDFYGFNMNWYGYTTPMTVAFDNPPLDSYYIAGVASLFGWSEWALHLAFLLPALAAVWGIYALARNYCQRPFMAALIALLTPVFLISATAVMCDTMELAFWVWTIVFFEKGIRTGNRTAWVISGLLAGLAFLTKYLGLSLVPLLLAYGFCIKRRPGWWLLAPLLPLLFVAGYEWLTFKLYGQGLLWFAAHESTRLRNKTYYIPWEKVCVCLSFVGACFFPVLLYAPILFARRMVLAIPCLMAAGLLILPRSAVYSLLLWKADGGLEWGTFLYIVILIVTGIAVFAMAAVDLWERRDAVSVLLLLWLSGMFVFTVALNWTIDGRSLLPALPAVGILAARRMDRKNLDLRAWKLWKLSVPAVLAAMISLSLVLSDYHLANSQRDAAMRLGARYRLPGRTTWFDDHSGFQYYIEKFGAKPIEQKIPTYAPGDLIVITFDARDFTATNFQANFPNELRLIKSTEFTGNRYLSTFDFDAGAGFYTAVFGPLPFAVGNIKPQAVKVFEIVKTTGDPKTEAHSLTRRQGAGAG